MSKLTKFGYVTPGCELSKVAQIPYKDSIFSNFSESLLHGCNPKRGNLSCDGLQFLVELKFKNLSQSPFEVFKKSH